MTKDLTNIPGSSIQWSNILQNSLRYGIYWLNPSEYFWVIYQEPNHRSYLLGTYYVLGMMLIISFFLFSFYFF